MSRRPSRSTSSLSRTTGTSLPTPKSWKSPFEQSPHSELRAGDPRSAPGRLAGRAPTGQPYPSPEENRRGDPEDHRPRPPPDQAFDAGPHPEAGSPRSGAVSPTPLKSLLAHLSLGHVPRFDLADRPAVEAADRSRTPSRAAPALCLGGRRYEPKFPGLETFAGPGCFGHA